MRALCCAQAPQAGLQIHPLLGDLLGRALLLHDALGEAAEALHGVRVGARVGRHADGQRGGMAITVLLKLRAGDVAAQVGGDPLHLAVHVTYLSYFHGKRHVANNHRIERR